MLRCTLWEGVSRVYVGLTLPVKSVCRDLQCEGGYVCCRRLCGELRGIEVLVQGRIVRILHVRRGRVRGVGVERNYSAHQAVGGKNKRDTREVCGF